MKFEMFDTVLYIVHSFVIEYKGNIQMFKHK